MGAAYNSGNLGMMSKGAYSLAAGNPGSGQPPPSQENRVLRYIWTSSGCIGSI